MTRLAVVVSDPHAGSAFGLMPRGFFTKEGNEIRLNPIQEWLMSCWDDCWDWFYKLAGNDEWSLILNGDLVDGVHHGTKEIWSNDESDHGIAAYHLLKPIGLKASSVFLTEGTEIHTKGQEHSIAYHLRSAGVPVRLPTPHSGAYPSLRIELAGTLCKFDHHTSTTSRPYLEASALSITMGAERVETARAGHRVPKVFGRAHRHKFGHFDDGYGVMFTTPPWQALTRYGRKVVPHAIPQVGLVVLDWRNAEDNSTPALHRRLHTLKEAEPVYS